MSDDEVDALGPDGQGSARVDRDRRAPRFSWTPAYEATFFSSLCESVQLGLRENSSFKAEAWERAMQALQETHGAHPAKSHLINKSDNARKRFRLWRGLREDPEFVYNPVARTVSASEEAWKAHIEREPLSRALRGRPFEHEDFMETLYPDVIGSGGAPKRVMKPRRRTDGTLVEDSEMPGTGVLNLQQNGVVVQPGMLDSFSQSRPPLQQTPSGSSSGSMASQRSGSVNNFQMTVPTMGNPAALTPPDEVTGSSNRKRSFQTAQGAMDSTNGQSGLHAPSIAEKRRRTSSHGTPSQNPSSGAPRQAGTPLATMTTSSDLNATSARLDPEMQSTLEDLVCALRTGAKMVHWREQALELFFREFADEDMDLQVKIAEGVLTNEGKAMVFLSSYADVAGSGPKQSPEEAAAPQPPEIIPHETASTSSLVDVDMPSVHTVPNDFLDQPVQTSTQAERIEREAAAARAKAERKAKEAKAKAKKADNWLVTQFSKLSDGSAGALALANVVGVVAIGGWMGYKGWGLYERGRLTWETVGLGVGIVAGVGVVESVLGSYLARGQKKKE